MSRDGEANGGEEPHFEGEEEFINKRAHWLAQKAINDKFDRMETRLDDQYHEFNNNIQLMHQQMTMIQ